MPPSRQNSGIAEVASVDGRAAFRYPDTVKLIAWLLLAATATAIEPVKLPLDVGTLKTRDGKIFEGAKVTGHDAVGVKIIHSGGVARVEYARLPKDLAERFPRDREAAKEQLDKEAKDEAANDRTMIKKVPATKSGTSQQAKGGVEKAPELTGDPEARISALEAYVRRLEDGIANSQTTIAIAEGEIKDIGRKPGRGAMDAQGNFRESRNKIRQIDQKRAEIMAEDEKIAQASRLISEANAQIEHLKTGIPPQ